MEQPFLFVVFALHGGFNAAGFFAGTFTGVRAFQFTCDTGFHVFFFAFHVRDNAVFLDFAFETFQRVFQAFVFANDDLTHFSHPAFNLQNNVKIIYCPICKVKHRQFTLLHTAVR